MGAMEQGKDGYVADAMEQALQLSKDMANLRSLRGHEVFLSLKRDLAMVSLSINPSLPFFFFFCKFPPLSSLYYFPLFTFTVFLSLAGYSSHVSGRGDNKFLPPADKGRRREMNQENQEFKSKLIEAESDRKSAEAT